MTGPDGHAVASAIFTYLAEPADPVLGGLLEELPAAEALARIRSGQSRHLVTAQATIARWRSRLEQIPADGGLAAAQRQGIRLVCPGDPEWPPQLGDLGARRPYALWVRGRDLQSCTTGAVSVVGSRAATAYGTHIAMQIAADLAEHGWAIVSGAAYGIDACAHHGALLADGRTVAVLACGPDVVYPPGHRIEITLRFDLPDPPDDQIAASIAEHAISVLASQHITTVIVIGYGPGSLVTPPADAFRKASAGAGFELRDVLRVEGDRYWSYLCTSPLCCPPAGVPFDPEGHPASVALTVASGQQVLASRGDLAATIAPVTGPVAETMRRETARAQRIAARLIARATATGDPGRPVTRAGLNAMRAVITTYRDGGAIELASQFAWLTVALSSLWVRDDAWARMDPAHAHAHERLWTDLTRHAQPGLAAAPASLLAFTTWQTGNGALANLALDRALADTPGYSMAQLLRQTIDAGAPPSLARLPMTPEEVAASYSGPPGSEQAEQWNPGASGTGDDSAS